MNVFFGYDRDNEPEKIYDIPDFKNGKEYIVTKENLFEITEEAYLDKKTINEISYKLRKNLYKNIY